MTELGRQLIEGMENALAYARGRTVAGTRATVIDVPDIDVRRIRRRLDLTQKSFAESFGFSLSAVLLAVIERHPKAVRDTIAELENSDLLGGSKRRADKRATL